MTRLLRVHKVSNATTTPEQQGEIWQFLQAIFADRAHTLLRRNTPENMLIYLRMERNRQRTPLQSMLRLDRLQERRWMRG